MRHVESMMKLSEHNGAGVVTMMEHHHTVVSISLLGYGNRYTAFSELLPLLAAGSTPLLKVKSISQSIDTKSLSIDNSTTLSSPFAEFSFSASASFEVRSPSRIEVTCKTFTLAYVMGIIICFS